MPIFQIEIFTCTIYRFLCHLNLETFHWWIFHIISLSSSSSSSSWYSPSLKFWLFLKTGYRLARHYCHALRYPRDLVVSILEVHGVLPAITQFEWHQLRHVGCLWPSCSAGFTEVAFNTCVCMQPMRRPTREFTQAYNIGSNLYASRDIKATIAR